MSSLKILLNIFYNPVFELRKLIQANQDLFIPVNSGSGLKGDAWVSSFCRFDDEGCNISEKNGILNEMTTIYWMWKNYEKNGNPDYIGFNHYRRFFRIPDISDYEKHDAIVSSCIFSSDKIMLYDQYATYHVKNDMDILFSVLGDIHGSMSEDFYEYVHSTGKNIAPCNMFIMRKDMFFEWCEFIFPVLLELENRIDLTGRDNYQKRALCFLTERLFGWWIARRMDVMDIKEVKILEFLNFKPAKINERGDFS